MTRPYAPLTDDQHERWAPGRSIVLWCRQTLEAARQALALLLRGRFVLLLAGLAVAFGAAFVLLPHRAVDDTRGDVFFGLVAYGLLLQFALPFTLLYVGVTAVHGDIEDRTATYLFVRPVGRSSLLLGKWLAASVLGLLLAVLALVCLHLGLVVHGGRWRSGIGPDAGKLWVFAAAAALGAFPYGAIGALFGAIGRRPLVLGGIFLAGWEVIVSNLPPQAGVRGATVADPLRRFLIEHAEPVAQFREALQMTLDGQVPQAQGEPVASLAKFTLVVLVLALAIYTRREYDSRLRE